MGSNFQATERPPASFQAHQQHDGRDRQVMTTLMTRTTMMARMMTLLMLRRVLCNKPVRPAMVSTLQQRWAATGGMPPQ